MKLSNLKKSSLLALLGLSSASLAQTIELGAGFDLLYKGSIGVESWVYPQDAISDSHKDYRNTIHSGLEFTYRLLMI